METDQLLAKNFAENHPADAARILEGLPLDEVSRYLEQLPTRLAAEVLQKMAAGNAAAAIDRFSPPRFGQIVAALPLDIAALLIRRIEPERQRELMLQVPPQIGHWLTRLLRYPENSAGALMDPQALALPEDITALEAMTRVRGSPRHSLYYVYVLNREHQLVGVLNLRELMLAPPKDHLSAVMHREVMTLPALSGRMSIVEHPGWLAVHALPVVDDQEVFLGVLRYETLRQLERESTTPPPAGVGFAAVLTFSELCWTGLAGALADLTSPVATRKPVDKERTGND